MPSAFRRAGVKSSTGNAPRVTSEASSTRPSLLGYRGVRPWTGGIHLTSVGLNDLDIILGGGQPLGTCILIREDRWTRDLALSLVKYWAAEAISQEQRLVIPVARQRHNNDDGGNKFSAARAHANFAYVGREVVEDWLTFLPRNLHWEKQKLKLEKEGEMALPQSLAILEEDEHEDDGDEGLKVAWQYKKSVQQQRAGLQHSTPSSSISQLVTSEIFCHSYDLSRCMSEQQPVDIDSHIVEMDIHKYERESLHTQALSMFRDLAALVANTKDEGKVIRLLLFHSDNALTAIVLPLLMVYIRKNYLPVVVLMCSTPTADQKSWFSLSRSADVVLSTEGFASRQEYPPPPEFRHLQGLLTLSVVSTITASTANGGGHFADVTMSRRPAAYLYGLKRDRRKLHIPLLHIPPEEYTEGGGSVGSGVRSGGGKKASESSSGNRPSGGMGCASNVGGNPLDF